MHEHRDFKRIAVKHLVSFEIMEKDHRTVVKHGIALELDFSRTGLHLELPVEVQLGDWLALSLAIEEQVVDVTGEVVWVTKGPDLWEVGFKLYSFPPEFKDMVRSWIED